MQIRVDPPAFAIRGRSVCAKAIHVADGSQRRAAPGQMGARAGGGACSSASAIAHRQGDPAGMQRVPLGVLGPSPAVGVQGPKGRHLDDYSFYVTRGRLCSALDAR